MIKDRILDFFKEHRKKEFTSVEIQKQLDLSKDTVMKCMKDLREEEEISFRQCNSKIKYTYWLEEKEPELLDEVTGRKIRTSLLNKTKLPKHELDEYMLEDVK